MPVDANERDAGRDCGNETERGQLPPRASLTGWYGANQFDRNDASDASDRPGVEASRKELAAFLHPTVVAINFPAFGVSVNLNFEPLGIGRADFVVQVEVY